MSADLIYEYWKTKPSYIPNKFDIVGSSEKYEGIDELEDLQLELDDMSATVFGGAGTFVNKTASTVETGLKEMFAMLTVQQPRKFVPLFTKKPTKKAKVSKEYAKKIRRVQRAMDKINRPSKHVRMHVNKHGKPKKHRRGGDEPVIDAPAESSLQAPAPKLSEINDFELGQIFHYQDTEIADANDYYGALDDSASTDSSIDGSIIDDDESVDESVNDDDFIDESDNDDSVDESVNDDVEILGGKFTKNSKQRQMTDEITELEQLRQDYEFAKSLDRGFHSRVTPNIYGMHDTPVDDKKKIHVGYIKSDFSILDLIDDAPT